jgi:trk system potassium uptake protein TrkH
MIDFRPVGYVIGLLLVALGCAMLGPMVADIASGSPNWAAFAEASVVSISVGALAALACANGVGGGLNVRQSFLLTTGVWFILPLFGAIPFILGATQLRLVDAYFESVSGLTTTGTTVLVGLDTMSRGILLWRGVLQWLGGLGIVIVAMVFLPVMKVGGMQFFQSEGFDTMGKVMPRALDIAAGLLNIYLLLTAAAFGIFYAFGMSPFEAIVHAFAGVSTGGFSTTDLSFGAFIGIPEYACSVVMILASVPFVRLMQLSQGDPKPLFKDIQVRAYLLWIAIAAALIVAYRGVFHGVWSEESVREAIFNVVSIFSGTGFTTGDINIWGPFPLVVLFCVGAIGGCTSSTGCSIKVFRYLVLFKALGAQIRRIHSAHRVVVVRLDGRKLEESVIDSVILLFTLFLLSFGLLSIALTLTGLSTLSAVTGAWTSIFNIGPVFGVEVGATGAVPDFPDSAKWLMAGGMLLGRLEIIAVIVLLLPRFWRS